MAMTTLVARRNIIWGNYPREISSGLLAVIGRETHHREQYFANSIEVMGRCFLARKLINTVSGWSIHRTEIECTDMMPLLVCDETGFKREPTIG